MDLVHTVRSLGRKSSDPGSTDDLHPTIQTPVLNRLGDVGRLNLIRAGQIGDRAADLENAAVGAGAQAQFVDGGFKKFFAVAVDLAVAL